MKSTHQDDDGWTLKSHRALMDERDLRYEQRFKAQEEALRIAKGSMPILTVISVLSLAISLLQMLK